MMVIRILSAAFIACLALTAQAQTEDLLSMEEMHEGFYPLFNGEDLSGWWIRGGDKGFVAENGMLISTGQEGGGDWIFTDKEYENFVLRYEYRVQPDTQGNSGVGIRATKDGNPAFSGMEIQVIRPGWEVPWQRSCALYATVPPNVEADNPAGEWNSVEVLVDGPRIRTTLNGQELYDVNITEFTEERTKEVEWQKALTDRAHSGHIALQNHGDRVEFRKIRLKDLPDREDW